MFLKKAVETVFQGIGDTKRSAEVEFANDDLSWHSRFGLEPRTSMRVKH